MVGHCRVDVCGREVVDWTTNSCWPSLDCSTEVMGYNVCLFTIPSIPYSTIHLLSLGKIQALLVLFLIYPMSIKFSKHSFFIHFYYSLTKNSLNRLLSVSICPSCLVLLMSYSPSHLSSLFQISDFKFKCPFWHHFL